MSSPQSTGSQEEGPAKKNLEQITFRFCSECSNMLYPKEDTDAQKLQFTCRTCSNTEEATSSCVYRDILNNAAGETAGVTQDVGSDPTVGSPSPSRDFHGVVVFCMQCGSMARCVVCGSPYQPPSLVENCEGGIDLARGHAEFSFDIDPDSDSASMVTLTPPPEPSVQRFDQDEPLDLAQFLINNGLTTSLAFWSDDELHVLTGGEPFEDVEGNEEPMLV